MQNSNMLIVIDYDETFTAHKTLWTDFIITCKALNVKVVCCTARSEFPNEYNYDILTDMCDLGIEVIFAGDEKDKWSAVEKSGYIPENAIWIDDSPTYICKDFKEGL